MESMLELRAEAQRMHQDEVEQTMECNECGAQGTDTCVEWWYGREYPCERHLVRQEQLDYHEVEEQNVPGTDLVYLHCLECEWEEVR